MEFMKVLIILNRNPYDGTDITWNALRLSEKLMEREADLRIFLMNDSVDLAREGVEPLAGYINQTDMLLGLIGKGISVKVCGTCLVRCGVPRELLKEIADIAIKYDLLVVSDEIYARLTYNSEHTCISSLPGMKNRVILIGGFSKAFAMTGWRVGFVAANAELIEAMLKIHQYTMMCAPIMGQLAAVEALKEINNNEVETMVAEYDRRRKVIVKGFRTLGLSCFEPKGAFYAFPSIKSTGMTSEEFCEALLKEEKVAVVPGSVFGSCGEGYIRCCYATSMTDIEEALKRIGRFLDKHRK